MRVPPRLFAVLLFVAVGMLALVVAGLLDWIVGVLFLGMEFLGEVLRNVFRKRRGRKARRPRVRLAKAAAHPSGIGALRKHPKRGRSAQAEPEPTPAPAPRLRVLVPVSGDEPDLIEFALDECRSRHAELLLLFLRPFAVMPMGPVTRPSLADDAAARATFERVAGEAERAGIPLRTLYAATDDRPAAIGEFARAHEADVVLVGSAARRGRLAGFFAGDLSPSILRVLPGRASLMIHAS